MAIQIDLADSNVGIPVPKAYLRIVGFGFDILTNKLQVAINAYISEAASRAGKGPVTSVVLDGVVPPGFLATLESGGRKVLYQWLRGHQAFATAVDLLDDSVPAAQPALAAVPDAPTPPRPVIDSPAASA